MILALLFLVEKKNSTTKTLKKLAVIFCNNSVSLIVQIENSVGITGSYSSQLHYSFKRFRCVCLVALLEPSREDLSYSSTIICQVVPPTHQDLLN